MNKRDYLLVMLLEEGYLKTTVDQKAIDSRLKKGRIKKWMRYSKKRGCLKG